jgi:hypothetical protein
MKNAEPIRSDLHGMRSRSDILRDEIGHAKEFSQYVAAPRRSIGHLIDEKHCFDGRIRETIRWPEKNKEVHGRFGHFIAEGTRKSFFG